MKRIKFTSTSRSSAGLRLLFLAVTSLEAELFGVAIGVLSSVVPFSGYTSDFLAALNLTVVGPF